ncbi:7231_t:CDS:2, partial [Racocetra fulgida]
TVNLNGTFDMDFKDCNQYITEPLYKDGSYYNGYFSVPFENKYKLILSLSNNTKYGKRGKQLINFQFQFMDENANLNTSSRFLFSVSDSGDDAIQPFGLMQKNGYFYKEYQKKLNEVLSTFPLVQLSESSNNIDDESQVEQLEKKINELELFLRDYVVEAQQLDKVYNNIENAKDK